MSSKNGKTQRITGKRDTTISTTVARGKGVSTTESTISGLQGYVEADQGIGDRGARREHSKLASANTGEILGRLENLERRFFGYVKAQQEHLDSRKKESELVQAEFSKEVADLKREILGLMQETELIE